MDAFLPHFATAEPPPAPAAPKAKPDEAKPSTNAIADRIDGTIQPELLTELKDYIEQCVVSTVSSAITTVMPDVVEATIAKQQQLAIAPPQPAPVTAPTYETPVPTLHQPRPNEASTVARADMAWLAVGGITVILSGVAAYAITLSAPAQTQQQNARLTSQLTQHSQQLLESNQQILDSKQRCGNFSLICSIKN